MMNMEIDRQSRSFSNNKRRVKSLATTHKTAKSSVIFHTHYNFFHNCKDCFYMSNDFLTNFLRKIFMIYGFLCSV